MEDNIAFIKAELLALKSLFTEEIYSLSRIMDRIRTEYNQSKILEKNENLRGEISSKDLIIKMLPKLQIFLINLMVHRVYIVHRKNC